MLRNDPDGWEVEQPWLWWFGEGNGPDVPPSETLWGNPPPGAGSLPLPVPPAARRCTNLICDTLAAMPWKVRRGRERIDTPPWVEDPQAKRRDARIYAGALPQWRKTPVEFRSSSIKSCLWAGESVWYVPVRDADGRPSPPIWQLNPKFLSIDGDAYVTNSAAPVDDWLAGLDADWEPYRFADGELIVTRGEMDPVDGLRGIGLLDAHMWDLLLAGQISQYAFNMLRAGVPNGYLKVNAPNLTRPKAQQLQRDWMGAHGGPLKRIAVLNATTEFHAIQLDPAALQLAQMREYSALDWCMIFGVNPYMLGLRSGDSNTYANIESRMTELAQFTLLPWAARFESSSDAELPRGTELKIEMAGILRADTLARYQAHRIGLTEPAFLTVEEVREMEDRPSMPVEAEIEAAESAEELARLAAQQGGVP
jgi:phage portal protein BeeE